VARRADLGTAAVEALAAVDRAGLELATRSFAGERRAKAAGRWRDRLRSFA
jgi:hypothetical protein